MNLIKQLIFIFFLLVSQYSNGNIDLLKKGDSLFNRGKYIEAKECYDSLFFSKELYSNSMLLKLSHIENNLGNFERAIFYLSKYQRNNKNDIVDQSLYQIVKENKLSTYDNSDIDFFLKLYLNNKEKLIYSLLTISVIIFLINLKRMSKKRKIIFVKSFFTINLILILIINVHISSEGIILYNNTFIMDDPSSGSDVYSLINKGEKIKIVDESDIWYEVEINDKNKFIRKKNILKIN
tara:strand:- start:60 stop:770 length:711 start_codon:yes stop_codon:yes gene_type:complete